MSEIHKFTGNVNQYEWEGVQSIPLEMEGIRDAAKRILIGNNEGAPNFIMRFFTLYPGGHSRLERHSQEHGVMVLQGKGKIQIGDELFDVNQFDAVFIEGNELHQFSNPHDAPFGFVCVIPKLD